MASYMTVKIGGNGNVVQQPVVQNGGKRNGYFLSGCLVGGGRGEVLGRREDVHLIPFTIQSYPGQTATACVSSGHKTQGRM